MSLEAEIIEISAFIKELEDVETVVPTYPQLLPVCTALWHYLHREYTMINSSKAVCNRDLADALSLGFVVDLVRHQFRIGRFIKAMLYTDLP